jgi:preprotein translocase subunit SecF
VRLELRMAVGALVAVVHDIIISVGVYSIFQFEVSPGTVIAFLTILGYSIYDTVVVFDKIKENEARAGLTQRMTYTDMVSLSMNQVLLRSLNTTITSIIPVVSILVVGVGIMGAVALGQFGIALFVGLLVGAYSSIMVATPVVAVLKEREPKYRSLREKLEASGGRRSSVMGPAAPTAAAPSPVVDGDVTVTPPAPAGAAPLAPPTGAIPPRPRKQGKKR